MGVNGATFDYTFFNGGPYSTYAQWSRWRQFLATLRTKYPSFVIDNRQQSHEWGMWVRRDPKQDAEACAVCSRKLQFDSPEGYKRCVTHPVNLPNISRLSPADVDRRFLCRTAAI